jgi:hypothetical protein
VSFNGFYKVAVAGQHFIKALNDALNPENITNQKSQLCFAFVFVDCQPIYIKNKLNICKRYVITMVYKILRLEWKICTIVFYWRCAMGCYPAPVMFMYL